MLVTLYKDTFQFRILFDADGVLDTVQRDGQTLSTQNRYVKQILNHADTIRAGLVPPGFSTKLTLKRNH